MPKHNKKKGAYTPVIDAELDLHGLTAYQATEAVADCLHEAASKGWGRVRIIVGKGTRSQDGHAVLPNVVKALLNKHGYNYTFSKLQHGGEGALEVFL